MLILTNGLTEVADEGFLKVANSLVKRIKTKLDEEAYVVTYDRKNAVSDRHIELNKLLLSRELRKIVREKNEKVLYIPFPAKAVATALRLFVLSRFARRGLSVLWVQKARLNLFAKILLKISGAEIIVLSAQSASYFEKIVPKNKVRYLKTGVDTAKFHPVPSEKSKKMKLKYGFDEKRPVILHVGHLKNERNIAQMLKLSEKNQILLVISTLFKDTQDTELRNQLEAAPNVCIIDSYQPQIQEIYQLCDVYFFPVVAEGNCIDVPLSCIEAAACNKPVVTTDYGEMSEFVGKDGFFFIDSFDAARLNELVDCGVECTADTRSAALEYDWDRAIDLLTE